MGHSTTRLSDLLSSLTSSLESAKTTLPEEHAIVPPEAGVSLLDIKNDIFLSYLQHLVFLILLKLRGLKKSGRNGRFGIARANGTTNGDPTTRDGENESKASEQDPIVNQLIWLRTHLEKGVKPLENRLQYQFDKVLRAAEDMERDVARQRRVGPRSGRGREALKHTGSSKSKERKVSEVDAESGASDEDRSGTESDSDGDDGASQASDQAPPISDLSYRPNPSAFQRPKQFSSTKSTSSVSDQTGVYRPPRITPMAPPDLREVDEKHRKQRRGPNKSATLDDFVASELSGAPMTETSVGSAIANGGRNVRSAKERAADAERREYEEANFIRLPKQGKKNDSRQREDRNWGGEDWKELDQGLDRISRLTKKDRSTSSILDRSRKRKANDGAGGPGMGDAWERRKRSHKE